MTSIELDAQLYVALVDKSIAINKELGLSIDTAPDNEYTIAGRRLIGERIGTGTLGEFFTAADKIREEQRKEGN